MNLKVLLVTVVLALSSVACSHPVVTTPAPVVSDTTPPRPRFTFERVIQESIQKRNRKP